MHNFPFGLQREAEIYCTSGKLALASDPQAPTVTQGMASGPQFRQLVQMPFSTQVRQLVLWTRNSVEQMNDYSEDNVGWMIALFSKSYVLAHGTHSFDEIYVETFKSYYQQYD